VTASILLCDDEVHIIRAAEIKFRRAGYDVRCAHDGQQAWELIEEQCPDLLITDCQMPRMNGLQLVERARSHEETMSLPIIMLTAKGFELVPAEIIAKWNVEDVLPKPFSPRELLRRAEEILARRRPECAPIAEADCCVDTVVDPQAPAH
jgi:two-component system, OmpR family, alkaline phosphatase synthesis response regulator PhoP